MLRVDLPPAVATRPVPKFLWAICCCYTTPIKLSGCSTTSPTEKHSVSDPLLRASSDCAVMNVSFYTDEVAAAFLGSRQILLVPLFIASPQVSGIGHHLISERRQLQNGPPPPLPLPPRRRRRIPEVGRRSPKVTSHRSLVTLIYVHPVGPTPPADRPDRPSRPARVILTYEPSSHAQCCTIYRQLSAPDDIPRAIIIIIIIIIIAWLGLEWTLPFTRTTVVQKAYSRKTL